MHAARDRSVAHEFEDTQRMSAQEPRIYKPFPSPKRRHNFSETSDSNTLRIPHILHIPRQGCGSTSCLSISDEKGK